MQFLMRKWWPPSFTRNSLTFTKLAKPLSFLQEQNPILYSHSAQIGLQRRILLPANGGLRVPCTADDSYNTRYMHSGLPMYCVLNLRAESIESFKMSEESGWTELRFEGLPGMCRRDADTTQRHSYSDRIWISQTAGQNAQ